MSFILTVLGVAFGGAIILGCLLYLFIILETILIATKLEKEKKTNERNRRI